MTQISVVIPTHNRLTLLRECINSVRAQTKPPDEIVVVDDGSNDETANWCIKQSDIVFRRIKNSGPSAARNLGVKISRSRWIAFIDSDDLWMPDHLESLLKLIEAHGAIEWIIANSYLVDATLNPLDGPQGFIGAFPVFNKNTKRLERMFPSLTIKNFWTGNANRQALTGNFLQPSGLLITKSQFERVGGFNESLRLCEDMDLLLRLVKASPAALTLKQTYIWRMCQSDSLASDRNALQLKSTACRVLANSGFDLVRHQPSNLLCWTTSLLRHAIDLQISKTLRTIKGLETHASLQAFIQTAIAVLNIGIPIFLSRLYTQSEFARYKLFGLFLSTAPALSFTAGFWSLLPFWQKSSNDSREKTSTAFKVGILFSIAYALLMLLISPLRGEGTNHFNNFILSASILFLLPATFLEHNLSFNGRALLSALIVAAIELSKVGLILLLALQTAEISLVFLTIFLFLILRAAMLFFANRRSKIMDLQGLNVINFALTLKDALPVCLAAALVTLTVNFERIYLSNKMTEGEFAIIAAGLISIPLVGFIEQSVNQRLLAPLASSLLNNNAEKTLKIMSESIRIVSIFALPTFLTVATFSTEIINFIYDDRYRNSAIFLSVFSANQLLACLPFDLIARSQGDSKRVLKFGFMGCIATFASVVIGYILFGAIGAVALGVMANIFTRAKIITTETQRVGIKSSALLRNSFSIKFHLVFLVGLVSLKILVNIIEPTSIVNVLLISSFYFLMLFSQYRKTMVSSKATE